MVSKISSRVRVSNRQKGKGDSKDVFGTQETKISEKTTEEKGNKIKVDIGVDASTSCVGICVLKHDSDEMLEIFPIKLTSSKFKDIFDKIIFLKKEFDKLSKYEIVNVYVEEPALKFTAGKSSAHTISVLAKINVLVCYEFLLKFGKKPTYINVNTGRKKLNISINKKDKSITNKQKVFNIVRTINKDFPWLRHEAKNGKFKGQIVYDKINEDMADSWVICRSGQLSCILDD